MKRIRNNARGFSAVEMLVVIGIIGVLVMVSLPNIPAIIASHRLRTANNDLVAKLRYIRGLAISKNRTLQVTINTTNETLLVEKMEHREYNLIDDVNDADFLQSVVEKGSIDDDKVKSFILFTESREKLQIAPLWDTTTKKPIYDVPINYDITSVTAAKKNGIGEMSLYQENGTTPATTNIVTFYPSGTIEPNMVILLKGDSNYGGEYRIALYKGGQIVTK